MVWATARNPQLIYVFIIYNEYKKYKNIFLVEWNNLIFNLVFIKIVRQQINYNHYSRSAN